MILTKDDLIFYIQEDAKANKVKMGGGKLLD